MGICLTQGKITLGKIRSPFFLAGVKRAVLCLFLKGKDELFVPGAEERKIREKKGGRA